METTEYFDVYTIELAIKKKFPKLISSDFDYLLQIILWICKTISLYNGIDLEIFNQQLKLNNYRIVHVLIKILFPHMDESKFEIIKNFRDIYKVHSNFKYNHFNSYNITYEEEHDYVPLEKDDSKMILRTNASALQETIKQLAYKYYVNWYNILPMTYNDVLNLPSYIYLKKKISDIYVEIDKFTDDTEKKRYIMNNINISHINYIIPHDDIGIMNEMIDYPNTVYISDIYQTLTHDFFKSMESIKWFIYDIYLEPGLTTPLIILLGVIFPNMIKYSYKNVLYKELLEEEKNNVIFEWNIFLNKISNGLFFDVLNYSIKSEACAKTFKYLYSKIENYVINNEIEMELIKKKQFIILNDKNKKKLEEKQKKNLVDEDGNVYQDEDDDEDEEEEPDYFKKQQIIHDMLKNVISVGVEVAYNVIVTDMDKFKKTYFFHKMVLWKNDVEPYFELLRENNYISTISNRTKYKIKFSIDKHVTCKNLYNFSKSLLFVKFEKQTEKINKYWCSLTPELKMLIIDRLNFNTDLYLMLDRNNQKIIRQTYPQLFGFGGYTWFNIKGNLTRVYPEYIRLASSDEMKYEKQVLMHTLIIEAELKKNFIFLDEVYKSLIYKGLLSKYVHNDVLQKIPVNEKKKKEYYIEVVKKNIEKHKDSYYYLTGTKYVHTTLFSALKKSSEWVFSYALDFYAQLNYYFHFTNNRVIYMSGGTGVGKSTILPVLALYFSKVAFLKGKVACSQPRISPTEDNAKRVSMQLGVPIFISTKKDGKDVEIFSNSLEIQFQHHNKKQVGDIDYFVRYITDGALKEQLSKNLLGKKLNPEYVEGSKSENEKYVCKDQNIYDIIIVDESHEHNPNMEIIFSIMRIATYINNQLKIISVSATLDSDEKRYRNYFLPINDNRLFPLSTDLYINKYIDKSNFIINRNLIDRRLDISIPGLQGSTKYEIKQIFHDDPENEDGKKYIDNAIKRTLQYTNYLKKSEALLLFLPGQNEIDNAVKKINESTNSDVLCLPFYSVLPSENQEFVRRITAKTLKSYTGSKTEPYSKNQVSVGTYNKIVIVATDIAEASITIDILKIVIDTGKTKVPIYNYTLNETVMYLQTINYNSYKQRIGRVGRVQSGTAVLLYSLEKVLNVKPRYKITEINFKETYLSLLKSNKYKNKLFSLDEDINSENVISKYDTFEKYIERPKSEFRYIPKNKEITINNDSPINNIIKSQYYLSEYEKMANQFYLYYSELYDLYKGNIPFINPEIYVDGFSIKTLDDLKGEFYIVHPDEMNYTRYIYKGYFELYTYNLTHDPYAQAHLYEHFLESFPSIKMSIIKRSLMSDLTLIDGSKSTFFQNIQKIKMLIPDIITDNNLAIFFIYSYVYGCSDELLPLIIFMELLVLEDEDIKSIFTSRFEEIPIIFRNKYSNQHNDVITIYNFVKELLEIFTGYEINIDIKLSDFSHIYDKHKKIYIDINNNIFKKPNYVEELFINKFTIEDYEIMHTIKMGNWKNELIQFTQKKIKKLISDFLINKLKKDKKKIEIFCKSFHKKNSLKPQIIEKFLYNYYFKLYTKKIMEHFLELDDFKEHPDILWFINNIKPQWEHNFNLENKIKILSMIVYSTDIFYTIFSNSNPKNKYIKINNTGVYSVLDEANKDIEINSTFNVGQYFIRADKLIINVSLTNIFEFVPYKFHLKFMSKMITYILNRDDTYTEKKHLRIIYDNILNKLQKKYYIKQSKILDEEIKKYLIKLSEE